MPKHSKLKIAVALGLAGAVGLGHAAAGWRYADVGGRWTARTYSGAFCSLGFAGGPVIRHGTISATGFCPAIFTERPHYWLDGQTVVIGTRRGEPQAWLTHTGFGRLEGRTATDEYLLLMR
jgi:hypothetical protein